jgi:phosphopantetheinyl transferase
MVCKFVGHHRSVSWARRIEGIWQSRCKRCGADIVRVRPTKWREIEKAEDVSVGRAH